jgi:SAM-dependent methyltransferase
VMFWDLTRVNSRMLQTRDQKERAFHDKWAAETRLSEIKVYEAFENITAPENRFILALMGDLQGVRVLDIGAGLGESSVYLALQGAKVTANDISAAMLQRCVDLGRKHGVEIIPLLGSADNFDFGLNEFDIVYGANVLHHIGVLRPFLIAVKRALVPGGRFFFVDPLDYNPIIKVYRRLAAKVRTEDEKPLRFADLGIFQDLFSEVHHREFWLSTLVIFLKYFFIDRIHPSSERYWKKILLEDPRVMGWWFQPLLRLDGILLRLPLLNYLAWNMVVWGSN